jgi:hypothetical protein
MQTGRARLEDVPGARRRHVETATTAWTRDAIREAPPRLGA